jgi:hypothetical protein
MAEEAKSGPVAEVRIGRVKAAIWRNEGEDGEGWFSVQLCRLYRSGEDWKQTASLGRDDLLVGAKVLDLAHSKIVELQAAGSGSGG